MDAVTLSGHGGTPLTVDACRVCHALWFDPQESLKLSPASTLTLFTAIGTSLEEAAGMKRPLSPVLRCPRCRLSLVKTHDLQRDVRFEYWRCEQKHGRFITYFNFLREKNFIRPLSGRALEELRQHVQTVNCSNCGAAIDLQQRSACGHCGSPLSILDMQQAGALIEQLRGAATPRPVDPALPLNLIRARREVEAAFANVDDGEGWWQGVDASDLVENGLATLSRLFRKNVGRS